MTSTADDRSVTVVTTHWVRPGREAELEALFDSIGQAAARFPGFLGRRIIRPKSAASVVKAPARREDRRTRTQIETDEHDLPEYVVVFRFDSYPHLRAWTQSAERRYWLQKRKSLVLDDEQKETVLEGLEYWFTLPGQPPPPRIKMALLTMLVAYPLMYGIAVLLRPWLERLPMAVRGLAMIILMVSLLTWVLMPAVTRIFRHWLYPTS